MALFDLLTNGFTVVCVSYCTGWNCFYYAKLQTASWAPIMSQVGTVLQFFETNIFITLQVDRHSLAS